MLIGPSPAIFSPDRTRGLLAFAKADLQYGEQVRVATSAHILTKFHDAIQQISPGSRFRELCPATPMVFRFTYCYTLRYKCQEESYRAAKKKKVDEMGVKERKGPGSRKRPARLSGPSCRCAQRAGENEKTGVRRKSSSFLQLSSSQYSFIAPESVKSMGLPLV